MSTQPPARNAAPAVPPVPTKEGTGNAGVTTATTPNERSRIVAAIARIDSQGTTPTSIRGLLGEYYKHLGQRASWPDFPVTLHQHPLHPDNSDRPFASIGSGLLHYVGNVVRAYQEYTLLNNSTDLTEDLVVRVGDAATTLARRLAMLEALVKKYPNVMSSGDIARGFMLVGK